MYQTRGNWIWRPLGLSGEQDKGCLCLCLSTGQQGFQFSLERFLCLWLHHAFDKELRFQESLPPSSGVTNMAQSVSLAGKLLLQTWVCGSLIGHLAIPKSDPIYKGKKSGCLSYIRIFWCLKVTIGIHKYLCHNLREKANLGRIRSALGIHKLTWCGCWISKTNLLNKRISVCG